MPIVITIVAFILVLSILVLIHEFGHFITAKKLGIKVEEFGFGFPPRVFFKKIGETIYSINLLPIGGFVKLYGEDAAGGGSVNHKSSIINHQSDLKRAFFARPIWQRFLIVFAGVLMNFLLAVAIISYLFSGTGVPLPREHIGIIEISPLSPAESVGLREGDEVLLINNKKISDTSAFIEETRANSGKAINLKIKRGPEEFEITVTPRKTFPEGQGPLGVAISDREIKKYPWYQAPFYGTIEAFKFSWEILSGLGQMVYNGIAKGEKPAGVAGPIGVAELTGEAISYGLNSTLWFVALLSLNLAVVNILPIPALDGGRLFFIAIEFVTRRKVSSKYEAMAHAVGLVFLLGLILVITLFDLIRVASGQSLLPKM